MGGVPDRVRSTGSGKKVELIVKLADTEEVAVVGIHQTRVAIRLLERDTKWIGEGLEARVRVEFHWFGPA